MSNIKLTILTIVVMLVLFSIAAFPCEIVITKVGDEEVKVGSVIILQIDVELTHRVCNINPDDTKFEADGMKIKAATKWKEIEPGKLQRKLKVEIEKAGELTLKVIRECRKGGAENTYKLTVND
jgi:hypothetical protein